MGPDKWVDVEKRVSKADAISMFNFKQGPKQKMLKVQYFKHLDIAHHLYMIDSWLPMVDFHGMMKCHIILQYFFT